MKLREAGPKERAVREENEEATGEEWKRDWRGDLWLPFERRLRCEERRTDNEIFFVEERLDIAVGLRFVVSRAPKKLASPAETCIRKANETAEI